MFHQFFVLVWLKSDKSTGITVSFSVGFVWSLQQVQGFLWDPVILYSHGDRTARTINVVLAVKW